MTEAVPAPAGHRFQVIIDCADPAAMTVFWCLALGYIEQPPPPGYQSWDALAEEVGMSEEYRTGFGAAVDPAGVGPRLLFLRVPESKTVKNRLHLDVNVGAGKSDEDRKPVARQHAQRLVEAGGAVIEERSDEYSWWIVMSDPEGNEFCVQ